MMKAAKPLLLTLGILMILSGILWIAQGTGYFPYPASSFMISQRPWILWGALLAVAGVGVIFMARRRQR